LYVIWELLYLADASLISFAWLLAYVVALVSLGLTHRSFGRLYLIDEKLRMPPRKGPITKAQTVRSSLVWPLMHHLALVIGLPLCLEPLTIIPETISFLWVGIVAATPVLALIRYIQVFKDILLMDVAAFQSGLVSFKELCELSEAAAASYREFSRVFGAVALLFIGELLLQMLFGAYFCVHFVYAPSAFSADPLWRARSALGCFGLLLLGLKYLHHLTSNVHHLQKAAETLKFTLKHSECVSKDEEELTEARLALLSLSISWSLPVHGYFCIDRTTVPVVLGHLFTLVIILVEFRQSNSGDSKGRFPCNCTMNATIS